MTREEQIINAGKTAADGKEFSVLVNRQHRTMSAYEIGFIEGAEWADLHHNWISVEDELPDVDEQTTLSNECVVVDSAGARYFGFYNGTDECWYTDDYTMILFVTHWMEIVPPRKEDRE